SDAPGLVRRTVRPGTGNIAVEPAMTPVEARSALDVGADVATQAAAGGAGMLVTGDMGNTTASAAVIAAITGLPAAAVTGRGAGADDAILARKTEVVERALLRIP